MANRIIFIVFIVFILFGITAFLFKRTVGDVRPAFVPPVQQRIQQTDNRGKVPFPLHVKDGFTIGVFAKNLGTPRDLEFSAGGTLLTSITGSGTVMALPDRNKDGQTDEVKIILSGLNKPHGLAFYDGKLFVAEETRVVRYLWDESALTAKEEKVLFNFPAGGRHFTRSVVFDKDGKLFVTIGSTCDVCIEKHPFSGSVIVSDSDGNNPRLFARGLRNSVFIAIHPKTNELWGTEMGRDFLGDVKPPDEINIIRNGKDYGWPYCYGNTIRDTQFNSSETKDCQQTEAPSFEICAHCAPLGLTFWQGDLLVAYHGSWNSSIPVGYKVVRMKLSGNSIVGEEDFVTGFLQGNQALGRPVDVTFDNNDNLFISDDKAGLIYLLRKDSP